MLLRIASLLVPERAREEWLAEWRAELEFVRRHAPGQAVRFCFGAWADAWWMRRNVVGGGSLLDSPGGCLALLAVLAAACCWFSGGQLLVRSAPLFALTVGIALLVLPASTPLRVGCGTGHRWWMFLLAKMALVLLVVFWGTAILVGTKVAGAGPHGIIPGIVLGLRWALLDQRRRCPQCLRRLRHPAGIGAASHTFLEWHGTELVCPRGHGLMHVSEIGSVSCYAPLRWLPLDASWGGLFRGGSGMLRRELPQE
ncbi:MAG: hypothetical protein U0R19_25700 [Bryobacteraceae bacterium]